MLMKTWQWIRRLWVVVMLELGVEVLMTWLEACTSLGSGVMPTFHMLEGLFIDILETRASFLCKSHNSDHD